jgi:hypothetical protein
MDECISYSTVKQPTDETPASRPPHSVRVGAIMNCSYLAVAVCEANSEDIHQKTTVNSCEVERLEVAY